MALSAATDSLELRCSDVHPCRCEEVFRASTPGELVDRVRRHGELVHCFTPVFYSPRRLSEITLAASGFWR